MAQAESTEKLHFYDYWRVVKSHLGVIVIVFLLVVATTAFVTFTMTPKYESTALLEVEPDRPSIELFGRAYNEGYDPVFYRTQFQIIQSKDILTPVMERLDLAERWKKEYPGISKEQSYIL